MIIILWLNELATAFHWYLRREVERWEGVMMA